MPDLVDDDTSAPSSEPCQGTTAKSHNPSAPGDLSLETVARTLAIFGIALYVLGLLVVNTYLFKIGASDFSLIRTRFILTGALAAICIAIVAIWVMAYKVAIESVAMSLSSRKQHATWVQRIGVPASQVLTLVVLTGFVITRLAASGSEIHSSLFDAVGNDSDLLLITLFLVPGILIISVFIDRRPGDDLPSQVHLALVPFGVMGALLLAFWAIDFFAGTIFPVVPEQFGGGRPKQVQLIMKPDAALLPYLRPTASAVSQPITVNLIWEGESSFLVGGMAQSDGPFVQIARDQIAAVVFEPATPTP